MTSMMYFWITWENKINNLFKYLTNKINKNQNKNNKKKIKMLQCKKAKTKKIKLGL
jgi:hypothetical protein